MTQKILDTGYTYYSWNSTTLESGNLILFKERVAEVISVNPQTGKALIKLTDEGGIDHEFLIKMPYNVRVLGNPTGGESELDDIVRATSEPTCSIEQKRRLAEKWISNPSSGDVFYMTNNMPPRS